MLAVSAPPRGGRRWARTHGTEVTAMRMRSARLGACLVAGVLVAGAGPPPGRW